MRSVPKSLGRYRIIEPLGSGAMGDVYLAEDPQIERRLAIKTVRLEGAAEDELAVRRGRLLMEAKAAGKLVHPNVVTLFDAGEEGGVVFLAFEFVDGVDLGRRLKQEPPLTFRELLKLVAQTAEALEHAHRNGIVHRDIKPGNILLTPTGDAKIADFGIAKMRDQVSDLTSTGTIIGTPFYMSPEQVRGETLDGRSDVFSLGSVLYEILHRVRPFVGDTITSLVYQILHHDPIRPDSLRPDLPPAVTELLARMLSKDVTQRYTSAREVATRTRQILSTLPAAVLEAPAYASMDGSLTTASTPASVVPPPVVPPTSTAPPPPPATSPPATVGPPEPAESVAPPGPALAPTAPVTAPQPAAVATAGASAPHATAPKSRAWIAALGCLAVAGVLGVGAAIVVVLQVRDRFGGVSSGPAADIEQVEQRPLPTPAEAAGSTPETGDQPADADLPEDEEVRVVVDGPRPGVQQGDEVDQPSLPADRPSATAGGAASAGAQPAIATPPTRSPTSSRPAVAEPEPSASDPPQPAGPIVEAVSREIQTAVAVTFRVQPEDSFVLMRAERESRFTQIGRAEDYDTRKRRRRPYAFPSAGTFYLKFRREGYPDHVLRVLAGQRQGPTVIAVNLAQGTSAAGSRSLAVREGVSFRGGAPRARVRVDGRDVGRLREFSGGRLLRLAPGNHEVVIVIAGRERSFQIVVGAAAPVARQTISLAPQ